MHLLRKLLTERFSSVSIISVCETPRVDFQCLLRFQQALLRKLCILSELESSEDLKTGIISNPQEHSDFSAVGVTKGSLLDFLGAPAKSVIKACVEDIQMGTDCVSTGEFHVVIYSDTQCQGSWWVTCCL